MTPNYGPPIPASGAGANPSWRMVLPLVLGAGVFEEQEMKCDKCGCEKPDPVKCPCPFPGGWPLAGHDRGETVHWTMPDFAGDGPTSLMYSHKPLGGHWFLTRFAGMEVITEQQAVDLFRLILAMRAVIEDKQPHPLLGSGPGPTW